VGRVRAPVRIRGLVFRGADSPPSVEDLYLDGPATGEVLVRMVASGVCHSDLHVVDGDWDRPRGVVLGHEGAGIVEALGPGVRERPVGAPLEAGGLRVGDLVVLSWTAPCGACPACERAEPWLCSSPPGGGHRLAPGLVRIHGSDASPLGAYSGIGTFCTRQVVAEAAAIAVDPRTPWTVAALIGCAGTTGVGAVRNTARVGASESVVIIGLGGVGLSALLAALDARAEPILAVDVEPSKRALAIELGATEGLDPAEAEMRARALPGGGADHVLECVGTTATVEAAIGLARPGASVTLVGMTRQGERARIDVYRFVEDGKRLLGSSYGSSDPARDFPRLAREVVDGRLALGRVITETIGLADVPSALESMRRRDGARRVVLY
jgi:S-(hydroxymethyl)glutathione dehydrogenase/alcohol dehydrogenase